MNKLMVSKSLLVGGYWFAVCLGGQAYVKSVYAQVPSQQVSVRDDSSQLVEPLAQVSAQDLLEHETLAFIKEHQPELLKLLSYLKANQPTAYKLALKEFSRNQQRLEGLRTRDPELYSIELELWQVRSKLRLLAAELTVASAAKRPTLENDLQVLIELQAKQELSRLKLLHQRATQQVNKLATEIADREAHPEDAIAKSLKSWENKIKKQGALKSGSSKNGSSKNADK